jgi:hypothetical protein
MEGQPTVNGVFYKFKVGDKVVFTNEYGVCFGVRTITGLDTRGGEPTYYHAPTDCPWFASDEKLFRPADVLDLEAHERGDTQYFQDNYGFDATLEQRAALLDLDYDI